jgi:adenylate cyclase
MNTFFNKKFEEEVLLNEKLRTTILACFFLFGILYTVFNLIVLKHKAPIELKDSLWLILASHGALFTFEVLSWLHIRHRIKHKLYKTGDTGIYINSLVEISSPGFIIVLLAYNYETPINILHAPVVYLYFIFIILSTLRLDFKLTLFTGFMAAVNFLMLSLLMIERSGNQIEIEILNNEYVLTFARVFVMLISGIGAAFVARQIRRSIDRSLEAADAGNKIVNLFGQQISKEIVDEMLESEGALQSKLMNVCVMFIDIRNFTQFAASKAPAEIVAFQNAFFGIVIGAVTKQNGIINQFLGDGCMVTFGAPVALVNPCQHAVNAALAIQRQLADQIEKGNIPVTDFGIGIHVGDAVTGNIGSDERQQYSITGSVVILAARIEQLNKQYRSNILVSEDVMQQLDHVLSPLTKFLGKVDLKGWHLPLGIYKIA